MCICLSKHFSPKQQYIFMQTQTPWHMPYQSVKQNFCLISAYKHRDKFCQSYQNCIIWHWQWCHSAIATRAALPCPECSVFWHLGVQPKLRVNRRLNFFPHLYMLVVAGSTGGWPGTEPALGPPSHSPCCRRSSPHHSS